MGISVCTASGPGYYTGGEIEAGDRPGVWRGLLAARLGLVGEVTRSAMQAVFGGLVAPDGSRIGSRPPTFRSPQERLEAWIKKNPEAEVEQIDEALRAFEADRREACLAVDLTWSPPKSVTVAHTAASFAEAEAARRGNEADRARHAAVREAIEAAVWEANEAAMADMEALSVARAGSHRRPGRGYWVEAGEQIRASFHQATARPVASASGLIVDPQQHIHNVVLNRARCPDGKVRALDTADLRMQRPAISAVAERVLAQAMERSGMPMRVRGDGVSREVVAVSPEVSRLFSGRRRVIAAAMEPMVERAEAALGRPLDRQEQARIARQATLFTRQAKGVGDDLDALLEQWQERMRSTLGRGLLPLAESLAAGRREHPEAEVNVSVVAEAAAREMAAKQPGWSRGELMLAIDKVMPLAAGMSPDQARDAMAQAADIVIEQYADASAPVPDGVMRARPTSRRFSVDAERLPEPPSAVATPPVVAQVEASLDVPEAEWAPEATREVGIEVQRA